MKARSFAHARRETASGFTLVELMIAVVVVALLASIALPSFMDSIRKSRRSEAFAALAQVQQAQERWRSNGSSYAESLTNAANGTPPGLGMASATTAKGYYTLSLSGAGASGYTVTATAVAGTSQASDGNCKVLAAQVQGGNLSYGSGADAAAYPDANRCWAK
ncbi:MAG: prepilin-type N-terminal cleavage/methylation domain-containing protein [Betaproteobacteria bacterium]|jgi:type IV pilus assembly protein PilE|nr:prepilin-type N-terminal cleavage/methylation domain-containing protein [Betaproteobacteria bacterium]